MNGQVAKAGRKLMVRILSRYISTFLRTASVSIIFGLTFYLTLICLPICLSAQTSNTTSSNEDMVLVPAGPVVIGGFTSTNSDGSTSPTFDSTAVDSIPLLPAYLIDRTEVTNADFASFLNSGHPNFYHPGMAIKKLPGNKGFKPYEKYMDHPVTYVNWYAAAAYAAWAGKRLPTKEEWEKAARGTEGTIGTFRGVGVGFPYPWGTTPPNASIANYLGTTPGVRPGTSPVGFFDGTIHDGLQTTKDESPYGLHDMAGNVWEWTRTKVIASPIEDDQGHPDTLFVIKGGGWRDPPENIRVNSRPAQVPNARASDIGFRCIRYLDTQSDTISGGGSEP